MHLLIPDTWHFHRRNFRALFDAIRVAHLRVTRERSRHKWWRVHGDYRSLAHDLSPDLAALPDDLATAEVEGIQLLPLALSEFLCLVLPRPRWITGGVANTPETVLAHALADPEDARDLRLCVAAARNWVRFWSGRLDRITHVLAFSGAYIYTRALLAVAAERGRESYCLESFFTGHEFYFEPRTTPLPNASQLGDDAYYTALLLPEGDARDRLRAEALARLKGMRNKNVTATARPLAPPWRDGCPVVLILGQVLNDFSLIGTPSAEVSSLAVYKRLIIRLLAETGCNVVFKAHPWERKRPHLHRAVTLEALEDFARTLPETERARLWLTENDAVGSLFACADFVVALCSQGLLEACQAGLKPVQLGNAFFGRRGFTHDLTDADAFIDNLKAGTLHSTLTISEYQLFEDFLVRSLLIHLIRNDVQGGARLLDRLQGHPASLPELGDLIPATVEPGLARLIRDVLYHPTAWARDVLNHLKPL